MKNLKLSVVAIVFAFVAASCGSKPAETTASETDSTTVETPAPAEVEVDSTTVPADSSAAQ